MDIEDAHKLKILPTAEVKQLLLDFFDQERQRRCLEVMAMISDPNEQIGYLRSGRNRAARGELRECLRGA